MPGVSTAIVVIFGSQLIAFSICILILSSVVETRKARLWILANLTNAASLLFVSPISSAYTSGASPIAIILATISVNIRYLALTGARRRISRQPGFSFVLLGNLAIPIYFTPGLESYRLILMSISGAILSFACILAIQNNRSLRRFTGASLMTAVLVLTIIALLLRSAESYPFGNRLSFYGHGAEQIVASAVQLLISFFLQISFVILLRDRAHREDYLAKRRTVRSFAATRAIEQRNAEMEKIAAERLTFLNLLTHEVRQPLNNAQAALHTIQMELAPGQLQRQRLGALTTQTQEILERVALALSNAILGTTMIERGDSPGVHPIAVADVAKLALTDCPQSAIERITFRPPDDTLFVHMDPILIRTALRNLLDNACKYSPAGSPILFEITVDELRCGVAFQITSELTDRGLLQGDIFNKYGRGSSAEAEGQGLGLFIVRQVARIHHGEVRYWVNDDSRATFELFIPD